jgi:hypothetical protein
MRRQRSTALPFANSSALLFGVAACLAAPGARAAGPTAADPFKVFVSDRFSYEDNLFRVADSVRAEGEEARGVQSFEDYVNRLSAGIQTRFDASRQVFALNLRVDDVRYQENDQLDHRGGTGDLKWNFNLGTHWSGLLDARYDRGQAGFSNYELFIKDVVDTQSYLGELRFKIGSRWALLAGGALTDTKHSAPERQESNMESETARFGIEYGTPAATLIALEYGFMEASFPVSDRITGVKSKFEQTMPLLRAAYTYSEKTRVNARIGYIDREFTTRDINRQYSGATWNFKAYWEPRVQLYFDMELWRELRSYSDSESNYFVSTGVTLRPTWSPTPVMNFALALSAEDQDYRNSASPVFASPDLPGRNDDVKSAGLTWEYTPRDYLDIGLSYRWLDRDSNRELRVHEAEIASATIRVSF